MSTTRFDPDELAGLESERDFLLRSLDDLEAERSAGNLEDDRYLSLKDEYTARAAAVLRSIEEGVDARPVPPPVSWPRRLLVGLGMAAFAGVAAVLLAGALGQRLPGGSATGNDQSDRRENLQAQVRRHPDSAAAHLAYARFLVEAGEAADAVAEYDAAARLDPKNAEAPAYAGWLVFLAARSQSGDPQAAQLPRATSTIRAMCPPGSPRPPSAAWTRPWPPTRTTPTPISSGAWSSSGAATTGRGLPEFERFLALAPEGPQSDEVRSLLEAAKAQAGAR